MEIEEKFISGFCRAQNQTRMVVCEFERKPDGSMVFLGSDCAYGACPHSGVCSLMAQAERENGYGDAGTI